MVAVHEGAPEGVKVLSLMSLVFMNLAAGLTGSLHFVILSVSGQTRILRFAWKPSFLSFKCPSVS